MSGAESRGVVGGTTSPGCVASPCRVLNGPARGLLWGLVSAGMVLAVPANLRRDPPRTVAGLPSAGQQDRSTDQVATVELIKQGMHTEPAEFGAG